MTDTLSGKTGAEDLPLAIGDAVSIARGALSGLRGTVEGFTTQRRCILAIDGLAEGVQIVISPESLTRAELTALH
jgi:hypothetical protein